MEKENQNNYIGVNVKAYYFGCIGQAGHYMHDENLQRAHDFLKTNPWGYSVDGTLCPSIDSQSLGIHWKDDWTALAFWDRSVDSRPGSNSVFLIEGTHGFDKMKKFIVEKFPSIVERFNCF